VAQKSVTRNQRGSVQMKGERDSLDARDDSIGRGHGDGRISEGHPNFSTRRFFEIVAAVKVRACVSENRHIFVLVIPTSLIAHAGRAACVRRLRTGRRHSTDHFDQR
jgi:hypothetical protein